jgi:plasmid stabilization system protein ParE
MRLTFHPSVAADISRIMDHYEEVGGERLAEEFYAELRRFFLKAKSAPEQYAIRARDLRRVNLDRFPYHFLYGIVEDHVRVLVVRHHNRRPSFATSRR